MLCFLLHLFGYAAISIEVVHQEGKLDLFCRWTDLFGVGRLSIRFFCRLESRKKTQETAEIDLFQVDLYSMFLLIRRVILDLIVFTFVDCAEGMNNSVPKRINSELRDPQEILSFQITLAVSIQSKKPANKEFMLLNVLIFLPRVQGTDLVLTESSLLLLKPSQELGAWFNQETVNLDSEHLVSGKTGRRP